MIIQTSFTHKYKHNVGIQIVTNFSDVCNEKFTFYISMSSNRKNCVTKNIPRYKESDRQNLTKLAKHNHSKSLLTLLYA